MLTSWVEVVRVLYTVQYKDWKETLANREYAVGVFLDIKISFDSAYHDSMVHSLL